MFFLVWYCWCVDRIGWPTCLIIMPGDLSQGKGGGLFVFSHAKVDARLYMITRLNSRNTWDPLEEKSSTVALRPQHLQTLLNAAGTVKLECEGKGRTHAEFTLKFDVSIKLRNNLISDHKAQSDTLSVHLLSVLDESEQFEKLVLISIADTNARVFNRYLQLLFRIYLVSFHDLHQYLYVTFLSKFEGV